MLIGGHRDLELSPVVGKAWTTLLCVRGEQLLVERPADVMQNDPRFRRTQNGGHTAFSSHCTNAACGAGLYCTACAYARWVGLTHIFTRSKNEHDLAATEKKVVARPPELSAPLVMTAPRGDIPHGFYHPMAHGDELVPAVHQNILLTAVEQELVPHLQRRGGRRGAGQKLLLKTPPPVAPPALLPPPQHPPPTP